MILCPMGHFPMFWFWTEEPTEFIWDESQLLSWQNIRDERAPESDTAAEQVNYLPHQDVVHYSPHQAGREDYH